MGRIAFLFVSLFFVFQAFTTDAQDIALSQVVLEKQLLPNELYQLPYDVDIPTKIPDIIPFTAQYGSAVERLDRSGGRFLHVAYIHNDTAHQAWVVDVEGKKLKSVRYHLIGQNFHQIIDSGYYSSGEFPLLKGRSFVLPSGESAYFLIEYRDSYFPKKPRYIYLVPQADYVASASYHMMCLTFLFGILLTLVLYSVIQAYQERNKTLLYYSCYLTCLITGFATHFGILQHWSDVDYYQLHTLPFMLAITFNVCFTVRFLVLGNTRPTLAKLLWLTGAIAVFMAPISIFSSTVSSAAFNFMPLIWACISIIVGVLRLRDGCRQALLFCMAIVWLVAPLFLILVGRDMISLSFGRSFDTDIVVFVGATLEALFLAFAIIHYQKIFTDSRYEFQKQLEDNVEKRTHELQQVKLEQDILIERLTDADSAKTQFLANMSHEIRTPLTAIIGYSDTLITRSLSSAETNKAHKVIAQNSAHLLDVINDILDISKIESGKITIEKNTASLLNVIDQAFYAIEHKARAKGIKVMIEHHYPLPKAIITDDVKLKQIIINLLGNAIKFTHTGKVVLHIGIVNNRLQIKIVDTGIGMTPDQTDEIFTPFMQGDYGVRRRYGGTGLGLSICKHFIELMQGVISVDSQIKRGTTFTIELPLILPGECEWLTDKDELGTTTRSHHNQETPRENYTTLTILLVDDHDSNREYVTLLLKQVGVNVIQVDSGEKAVNNARSGTFDMILMDIQMPVMDGITAFKMIREFDNVTPIVALTANNMQHEIDEYQRIGFNHYLAKPIQVSALQELLAGASQRKVQIVR